VAEVHDFVGRHQQHLHLEGNHATITAGGDNVGDSASTISQTGDVERLIARQAQGCAILGSVALANIDGEIG